MDKKKVEILAANITKQCEQQGFTVEEAQLLPAMLKSAIAHSIKKLKIQSASSPQDEQEKAFFLCDGKVDGCIKGNCFVYGGGCRHTTDIKHAINFHRGLAQGQYRERVAQESPSTQGGYYVDWKKIDDLP